MKLNYAYGPLKSYKTTERCHLSLVRFLYSKDLLLPQMDTCWSRKGFPKWISQQKGKILFNDKFQSVPDVCPFFSERSSVDLPRPVAGTYRSTTQISSSVNLFFAGAFTWYLLAIAGNVSVIGVLFLIRVILVVVWCRKQLSIFNSNEKWKDSNLSNFDSPHSISNDAKPSCEQWKCPI